MTSWRFARVLVGMWWVFLSVGLLIPLLPRYLKDVLGVGAGAVGVTVLIYAVSGILARPVAGVYLRRGDPWPLMGWSVVVGVAALVLTPLVDHLAWMLVLRSIDGFVLGCFYTAAATTVVQGVPASSRGSALSYFSVPLFLGTAVGPLLGDQLIGRLGPDGTWIVSGALLSLALPACLGVRSSVAASGAPSGPPPVTVRVLVQTLVHPSAVWPAAVLALIISGWAAFQAFVPLYGPELGMSGTGPLFLVYSLVVLAIRIGGARLFDRLPLVELVVLGAAANVIGLLVAWWWARPAALFVASGLMAVAIGLSYTTLMRMALEGVPPYEEGAVVGAYSISYDIGAGVGAAALGALVSSTGRYPTAFLGGAIAGMVALVVLLLLFWAKRDSYTAGRVAV